MLMIDIIKDTLLDTIKLIPFLFIAFLIIEIIEHKLTDKNKTIIRKSGKYGPIAGGVLGVIPQCGFSTMATNLYITRIISLGTLISIYLSCSDEMLPIMLSRKVNLIIVLKILLIKMIIGIISGSIIDFVMRRKNNYKFNYDILAEEHSHCNNKKIIISSLNHTIKIGVFILGINFLLNLLFYYVGEDILAKFLLGNNIFCSFITSLIGLIPNCGSSVMITELYLNNIIGLGPTMAGLLSGSGVALFILFKSNKNLKENMLILLLVYGIGVLSGIVIEVISLLF
jgi:hypothetical protein